MFDVRKEKVPQLFECSSLCFSCCFPWTPRLGDAGTCEHLPISLLPVPAPHRALCQLRALQPRAMLGHCAGSSATPAIPPGQEHPWGGVSEGPCCFGDALLRSVLFGPSKVEVK